MPSAPEGLKSDALRAALQAALRSSAEQPTAQLEQLLMRHSGLPGLRPNLKLAKAVGSELAEAEGRVIALLQRWADDSAAPDTARVFLPIVAAHGLAQRVRVGSDREVAWEALRQLAADERGHVRAGALDALVQLGSREGFAQELLERSEAWLSEPERELCFGATATALEAFADVRVSAGLRAYAPLCEWFTRVFDAVTDAPRAASRSDGRRRVLRALPGALAHAIAGRGARETVPWFRAECERATHPELRAALSDVLQTLPDLANAPARSLIDELRAALEGSQKPLRDAARVRPGTGRGRRSRALR